MPTRTISGIFLDTDGAPATGRTVRARLAAFVAVDGSTIAVPLTELSATTDSVGAVALTVVVPATGTARYELTTPKGVFAVFLGVGADTTFAALLTAGGGASTPQSAITTALDAHAAASDPHPQYQTQSRGDARYATNSAMAALLASEASARAAADTALDTRLDALESTPPAHSHGISQVTGLQTALDGKAATAALASEASARTSADDALDTRLDALETAPPAHGHSISQVTGLQTALDGKAAATALSSEASARATADDALDTRLDALETAPPAHGHTIADTTGLQDALDDTATIADLSAEASARTAADSALDARVDALEAVPPAHSHSIGQITGLQAALDDTATAAALTSEASARTSADAALDTRLDALEVAPPAHTHAASAITSGMLAAARLPSASTSTSGIVELATDGESLAGVVVQGNDARLSNSRTPTGGAGGALSGSYPNPGFAVDMATQAELDGHAAATTGVHGITAAGAALLDDADTAAQRATLGLGTAAQANTGTGAGDVPTTSQADARYQPLDSDLTAIAALSTTSFGRGLLALADAAALRGAAALLADGRSAGGGTTNYTVPGVEWISTSTRGLTANRIYYAPALVTSPVSIDQLALEVTTAAASSAVRVGIYNADSNWQPTSLLLDAGTVGSDTTGVKTISVSQALPVGRYLFCLNTNGAVSLRSFRGGGRFMGLLPALGTSPFVIVAYVSSAYAAFASTGLAWDTTSGGAAPMDHLVLCRVSTP